MRDCVVTNKDLRKYTCNSPLLAGVNIIVFSFQERQIFLDSTDTSEDEKPADTLLMRQLSRLKQLGG